VSSALSEPGPNHSCQHPASTVQAAAASPGRLFSHVRRFFCFFLLPCRTTMFLAAAGRNCRQCDVSVGPGEG
jgi:hypothetical protein